MMRTWQRLGVLLVATVALSGCGSRDQVYEVKAVSGLEQARKLLQNYAAGQPLGSETTVFPEIVAEVRQEDPAKAVVLERGFAALQRTRTSRAAAARDLLRRL